MNEIVTIPFHGGEILAVAKDGKPHIVLKPAVEHIGLSYASQYAKLQGKSWATISLSATVAEDGKARQMVTVDLRTFFMLLATIDENRVAPEAKDVLIAYQNEVADVIEAYFTKGTAISPRMHGSELAPMTVTYDEAMAIYFQRYGYDYQTSIFTQGLRLAGYLRQGGCVPRRKKRKFFFFNGGSWEIRFWALDLMFGEFEKIARQFQPMPFAQPRLDDGMDYAVLPVKRGES